MVDAAGKVTSSRIEIPDTELPVQVSSISSRVIEQQGSNDLVSALRNASGVTAQRFYGLYEYYTIRGFFGSAVLLDGMRVVGNSVNTQLNNAEEVGSEGAKLNPLRKRRAGRRHQRDSEASADTTSL